MPGCVRGRRPGGCRDAARARPGGRRAACGDDRPAARGHGGRGPRPVRGDIARSAQRRPRRGAGRPDLPRHHPGQPHLQLALRLGPRPAASTRRPRRRLGRCGRAGRVGARRDRSRAARLGPVRRRRPPGARRRRRGGAAARLSGPAGGRPGRPHRPPAAALQLPSLRRPGHHPRRHPPRPPRAGRRPARRRSADRARAPAAARARGPRDRDRRSRLRGQPDLRQHPHRRLRPLHRHRAHRPRALRGPGAPGDRRRGDSRRGRARPGRGRIARLAAERDRRPTRRRDRGQRPLLARGAAGGRRPQPRAGRPAGPADPRPRRRLPAADAAGGRRPRALHRRREAARPARGPRPGRADAGAARRLPGPGRGLRADGGRTGGRRARRLAAHLALADRPQPGPRRPLLRHRQRARGDPGAAGDRRHGGRARRLRAAARHHRRRRRLPRRRPGRRLRLRRRALRRRRRRGDRLPGRRRRRRGTDHGSPLGRAARGRRPPRSPRGACGHRPGERRRCPPDQVGARRGGLRRPCRRRRAPPAPLRPQLRACDHLPVPAAGPGRARRRRLEAGPHPRLDRDPAGLPRRISRRGRGDRDRHPRQRLGGAPARGRHRIPARLHRLRLGGGT